MVRVKLRSRKQTLAKHARLNVAFGFAQRLFVCRRTGGDLPVPLSRQVAKPCTTECHPRPSTPFCSSEHRAGSSAWSTIFEILVCPLLRLAASYVSRSYTLDHPEPCRAHYPALWDQRWFQQSGVAHAVPITMFDPDNLQMEHRVTATTLSCHVFHVPLSEHVRALT